MAGMLGELDPYFYGRMRASMHERDPLMHSIIAPLEHKEFAREAVGRNPMMAAPMAAAIPLYTGGKVAGQFAKRTAPNTAMMPGGMGLMLLLHKLGLYPQANTSPPSFDEMLAGYEGMFSGLKDNLTRK